MSFEKEDERQRAIVQHGVEQQLDDREALISHFQMLLTEREESVRALSAQLNSITKSKAWVAFQRLWNVRAWLKAKASFSEENAQPSPLEERVTKSNGRYPVAKAIDKLRLEGSDGPEAAASAKSIEVVQVLLNRSRAALDELRVDEVRAIAFYLPQFHPIPENDRWWGKGFTEWTNVTKARPNFEGHYQPHLPADMGFYDLRIPEVRQQQADLAREYGIHGFCYYYYWFGGKRLLERPFNEVLSSGRPDFPFCICWANENWTRRWDGAEHEILIAQSHSDEDDRKFVRSLVPAFKDRRYIRVNGKPLLLVYRIDILPNPQRTADIWREEMKAAGRGEIYLCAAQSFGVLDPTPYGFDAAVEFPPHGTLTTDLTARAPIINSQYAGNIYDYLVKAESMIHRPAPDYTLFKSVMPGWDNTPRRQSASSTFVNSSPEAYEYWLGKAVEYTITRHTGDERLVFINAWNEWGEGAHLEPDRRYGHRFLEATRDVLKTVRGDL
ncbi:MAG: glycosyltransferase WbsX family protein [Blastocatellia bacterium]